MKEQIPLEPAPLAEIPHDYPDDGTHEVAPDVAYKRLAIVNVVFVGLPPPGIGIGCWSIREFPAPPL